MNTQVYYCNGCTKMSSQGKLWNLTDIVVFTAILLCLKCISNIVTALKLGCTFNDIMYYIVQKADRVTWGIQVLIKASVVFHCHEVKFFSWNLILTVPGKCQVEASLAPHLKEKQPRSFVIFQFFQ